MSLLFLLYLADIVGNIKICFFIMALCSALTSMSLFTLMIDDYFEEKKILIKAITASLIAFFLFIVVSVAMPSKTYIYQAIGLKVGKEVLENGKVSNAVEKVYKIVDNKLNEILAK